MKEAFIERRHWLEESVQAFLVLTDHKSLVKMISSNAAGMLGHQNFHHFELGL